MFPNSIKHSKSFNASIPNQNQDCAPVYNRDLNWPIKHFLDTVDNNKSINKKVNPCNIQKFPLGFSVGLLISSRKSNLFITAFLR